MKRRRSELRAAALAGVCAVLLAVVGCAPQAAPGNGAPAERPAPEAPERAPLLPDDGVYLGVYYGDRPPEETNAAIGARPQIHLSYFGWQDDWAADEAVLEDLADGRLPLVNWEPFDVNFADIVSGRYDDMLETRARGAATLPSAVFVDFAAEMNEEEGWGGHDPELYIAAYRHVHDVFREYDGGKTVWVWAPNNVDSADAPTALEYYPGDAYVDWTGIDGYNWGTSDPGFSWQTFESVFRDVYDDLVPLGKPIIIGETASAEEGGSKAEWIRDMVPTLRNEFPEIRAVVWFDVDKERDWRIGSSQEAEAAFRAAAADPLFAARVPKA